MNRSEEKPRANIYARITDRVVAELERGASLDAAVAFRQWQRKRDTAAAA
jgi:antirestriction protein ArdC